MLYKVTYTDSGGCVNQQELSFDSDNYLERLKEFYERYDVDTIISIIL